jgi:hypothetical protein
VYGRLQKTAFKAEFIDDGFTESGLTIIENGGFDEACIKINRAKNATAREAVSTLIHEVKHVELYRNTGLMYGVRNKGEYMARAREFLFKTGRRPSRFDRKMIINEIKDLGYGHGF